MASPPFPAGIKRGPCSVDLADLGAAPVEIPHTAKARTTAIGGGGHCGYPAPIQYSVLVTDDFLIGVLYPPPAPPRRGFALTDSIDASSCLPVSKITGARSAPETRLDQHLEQARGAPCRAEEIIDTKPS